MIECVNHRGEKVQIPKDKFRFRPSVYGVIRNGNKICICRNKSSGHYWFPGGAIERGESMKEALLREIEEETGLAGVKIGRQIGAFENFFYYGPTDEAMQAFLFFMECETSEWKVKENEKILDAEATDFQWVEIASLKKDDFSDLKEEIFSMLKVLSP
jgi:8-oxo-dGTP diphosphatase